MVWLLGKGTTYLKERDAEDDSAIVFLYPSLETFQTELSRGSDEDELAMLLAGASQLEAGSPEVSSHLNFPLIVCTPDTQV